MEAFATVHTWERIKGQGYENSFRECCSSLLCVGRAGAWYVSQDRKSTRLNSSHSQISYAVFCLKKKKYLMEINVLTIGQLVSSSSDVLKVSVQVIVFSMYVGTNFTCNSFDTLLQHLFCLIFNI